MSETIISITVDDETKRKAEEALAAYGYTSAEFLAQVLRKMADQGWALADIIEPPRVPNQESREALEELRRGEFVGEFRTVEELMAYLHPDADD
jgi:antitoxin component of RelBE/YafQ-DinJ toxin-antitoxin module